MKNMREVSYRLMAELNDWYIKQCRNPFEDYYLYYVETTPEHIGGFTFCRNQPPNKEYKIAHKACKASTVQQNYNVLIDVVRRLPILEV